MDCREKRAFFKELWSLDEESDSKEDECEAAAILAMCPPIESKKRKKDTVSREIIRGRSTRPSSRIQPPRLSKNTPRLTHRSTGEHSSPVSNNAENPVHLNQSKNEDFENLGMNAEQYSKILRKRKRPESVVALPESRQIFKGCLFYFFPDNDIASSRRYRIRKALEYGACWTPEWKGGVTHIIADRGLTYNDLIKYMKDTVIPASVHVVSEDFPADCIRFGFMQNPRQYHYQIKGDPNVVEPSFARQPKAAIESLELKPTRSKVASTELPRSPSSANKKAAVSPFDSNERSPCESNIANTLRPPSAIPDITNDALKEAIKEATLLNGLPLDSDEETMSPGSSPPAEGDTSEEDTRRQLKVRTAAKRSWQETFSCMSKHDGNTTTDNPNGRTIEILQQMQIYYEQMRDRWRSIAYRKAISALKKQDRKIISAVEALTIPSIGPRLAEKIEEIVLTDRLRRLDNARLEPHDEVLQTFINIYGVGLRQASRWIHQGYRTLDDLMRKARLSENQKVGILHHEDFNTPIPRSEMDQHNRYMEDAIREIDPNLEVTIGGSYRRGQASSGDIDFIVTRPDGNLEQIRGTMIGTVIPRLFQNGYLRIELSTGSDSDSSKWHGAATLPGSPVWRRIDFLFVPWAEMGAALIYFTGNDIFNRSMRLLASKKGLRLNQRGLWKDVIWGPNRERLTHGTLLEGRSEKRIFELLEVPWRPPEHRLC